MPRILVFEAARVRELEHQFKHFTGAAPSGGTFMCKARFLGLCLVTKKLWYFWWYSWHPLWVDFALPDATFQVHRSYGYGSKLKMHGGTSLVPLVLTIWLPNFVQQGRASHTNLASTAEGSCLSSPDGIFRPGMWWRGSVMANSWVQIRNQ